MHDLVGELRIKEIRQLVIALLPRLVDINDMLRNEGERVSREIAGYASLSYAAMTAMKVIGDSLTQWKSAPNKNGPRSAS